MKLIGLLVLLALVSLVEGEVVKSFNSCRQFFVQDQNKKPVTTVLRGAQYEKICQKYKNVYRYATLYDTRNRIPVYSAYRLSGSTVLPKKKIPWMIEPQLDLEWKSKDWKNMAEMTTSGSQTHNGKWGEHQALDIDYSEQQSKGKYQRGHLYPRCHNCNQDQAESTFTLTNAAPQTGHNNKKWFNTVEKVTTDTITKECEDETAYVVSGVVPGDKWIGYGGEKRVNVPSYFWSAFCCKGKDNQYLSEGFLAATEQAMMAAQRMSVQDLNEELSSHYSPGFKVFGDVCRDCRQEVGRSGGPCRQTTDLTDVLRPNQIKE